MGPEMNRLLCCEASIASSAARSLQHHTSAEADLDGGWGVEGPGCRVQGGGLKKGGGGCGLEGGGWRVLRRGVEGAVWRVEGAGC